MPQTLFRVPDPREIRIAIADSHPNFLAGLCGLLKPEADFRVVARAGDGTEILEAIAEHEPDILLLDLCLPGSAGWTALKKLWKSQAETKVIVLAASKDMNQFVQAMRFGARGVVMKQTGAELIIKSIRKVHAGEIWLDSDAMVAVMRQFSSHVEPTLPVKRDEDRLPLSQRELELVAAVTQGYRNKEIAAKLSITEQTVKNHLHSIFEKLEVSDRLELALYAVHNDIRAPRIAGAPGSMPRKRSGLHVCPRASIFTRGLRMAVKNSA